MNKRARTQCEDLKLTNSHVVSDGKLNDDVCEWWHIVRTIQRDCCSSSYCTRILTTERVVAQGRF